MSEERLQEIEVTLKGGRRVILRRLADAIAIVVEGTVVLELSRSDAWELAEALDALATES